MEFTKKLEGVRRALAPMRYITPEEGEYFFGYYDLPAYNADGTRHLASRLPFSDHDRGPEDEVEIGEVDVETRRFYPIARTSAWCFQQNCMLQYGWEDPDLIFYNTFEKQDGTYHTVRRNLKTGEEAKSSRALATVSRNGQYGLSINFPRVWDFRAGYGYCNTKDRYFDDHTPKEDGVFLCDFAGNEKMLFNYEELDRRFATPDKKGAKIVVNHITLNPSGNRFLMLLRNFRDEEHPHWSTSLLTGDLQGNLRPVSLDTMVSHYWWLDDKYILAYASPEDHTPASWKGHLFLIEDCDSHRYWKVGSPLLSDAWDIHCSVSPDGRYLIGDSYPPAKDARYDGDSEITPAGYRHIRIQDMHTGKSGVLCEIYSPLPENEDIRCDLHARFSRDGKRLSFDSIARGKREILEIDLTKLDL